MELKDLVVLYVEDDITIRKPMTESLRMIFKGVLVAKNGDEGFEKYSHNRIDVIITDLNMPSDGVCFIDKVRSSNIVVPIIITTGYSEFRKAYLEVDRIFTLVKPFSIKDIMAIIKDAKDTIEENRMKHVAYDKLKVAEACAKRILRELRSENVCDIIESNNTKKD